MKTKGHWVIKTSAGGYWCGNAHFDPQLRKAQVYHWKEAAEDQIEVIKKRKYISADLTFEVVAIAPPQELKDTEAEWIEIKKLASGFSVYECSSCRLSPGSFKTKFCPHCGKRMTNHDSIEENL